MLLYELFACVFFSTICLAVIIPIAASYVFGAVTFVDLTRRAFSRSTRITTAVFATSSALAGLVWIDVLQHNFVLVFLTFLSAMPVVRLFIGKHDDVMLAEAPHRLLVSALISICILLTACGCLALCVRLTRT